MVKKETLNRQPWIDFLRGIAMICVVYWHCSSIPEFNAVTGGYYLPMFYALSGYLFNKSYGLKLVRLFKRIYFPLFIFGVLPCIIGPLIRLDINTVLSNSFYSLTSWFLPTFFASSVVFRLLAVYIKDSFLAMIISVFLFFTGFELTKYDWAADYYSTNICFSTILVGQFCIMLGYMWKKYERNHDINMKAYRITSIVSLCLFFSLVFLSGSNRFIDFHTNTYPNFPIGIGIILSSLLFGYSLTRNFNFEIVWLKPFVQAVCYIGRYAIFVFLLHHYLIAILDSFILKDVYPHIKLDYLNAFVYTILTLLSCYIIISFIRKIAPSLLGEKRISLSKMQSE